MKKNYKTLLIIIFLVVLAARLYFAFSTPYFSSDDSYFHLRQVESIRETSQPVFEDRLSFSGRTFIFSPVFHYILAFFSLFMPVSFAAKLIPNIFASLLVFFIYLIVNKITKNSKVALFTAFLSGFVPVFFSETATRLTALSMAIPLIFLLIYSLMNIKQKPWLYCYLATLVVLSFIHPLILLFILGLGIYLLLVLIEKLRQSREELEVSLFSIFFVLWAQFLIYKKIFIFHGLSIVWQNIPAAILSEHFAKTTIIGAIIQIGIIPFIAGLYVIYLYLFKKKQKEMYLMIAFAASAGMLLWLRFIELKIGMIFFGLILVVLFGQWFNQFIGYVKQTRVSNFLSLFVILFFAAFLLLSVYPSLSLAHSTSQKVTHKEIIALEWIRDNTPVIATIAATVHEGNLITGVSQRKNIIDSNFLMMRDSNERFGDIQRIYTTSLEFEAVDLMDKYGADYIFFSNYAKSYFQIDSLNYVDGKCFSIVYDDIVQIYEKLPECRVRTV